MILSLLFAEPKPCICVDQPMTEAEICEAIKEGVSKKRYSEMRSVNNSYGWGAINIPRDFVVEIYAYDRGEKHKLSDEQKEMILKTAIRDIKASKVRCSVVFINGGASSEDWLPALKKISKNISHCSSAEPKKK